MKKKTLIYMQIIVADSCLIGNVTFIENSVTPMNTTKKFIFF